MMTAAVPDLYARALRYPFDAARVSCIVTDDAEYPFVQLHGAWDSQLTVTTDAGTLSYAALAARVGADAAQARTAVLAYGSNASPEVLRRKFAEMPGRCIPLLGVTVNDLDVVYSAHLRGGYVPATVHPMPGARIQAFLVYLTDEEIVRMHETESLGVNYAFVRLPEITVAFPDGTHAAGVLAYASLHGVLAPNGAPIPLAAINGTGRLPGARSEPEALEVVRALIAPEARLRDLVVASARSGRESARLTERLRPWARQSEWDACERVAP